FSFYIRRCKCKSKGCHLSIPKILFFLLVDPSPVHCSFFIFHFISDFFKKKIVFEYCFGSVRKVPSFVVVRSNGTMNLDFHSWNFYST
ncbi:hypothetical protein E1A91_D11G327400v1, partial [Gossypium mustelinum]